MGSCVSATSASRRCSNCRARPLPTASTCTSIPVSLLSGGRIASSRPELSKLVVVDTRSCRPGAPHPVAIGTTKQITRHRRISSIDDLIYDLDRAAGAGKTSTMENLPIGCTLRPAALKARRDDLLPGLVRRAVERLEIPNGYRVRFTPDDSVLTTIANVIETERQCCRFLTFRLTAEPDNG